MAGNKRTTRSKAAPAKRSTSPVEEKVQVLTKQQFSKLSVAVVKAYAVRNGLDPNMPRKDIAATLFSDDKTILAGHKMNWSAPWTPQNAPASLATGTSSTARRESDIEHDKQRLRNGEVSDLSEQYLIKEEAVSALLHSKETRRSHTPTSNAGEGSQAQPLVVDADGPRADHAFANQTTSATVEPAISAASQTSYPSPALSTLESPLAQPHSQLNNSSRQGKSSAPTRPSNLNPGKRPRTEDDEDSMQEGESDEGSSERPAKQPRLATVSHAPQQSSTADKGRATPSPPSSLRLTAAQKGKGKVTSPPSPPTPHSPARDLVDPISHVNAAVDAQSPVANGPEQVNEVNLQHDIEVAQAAASTELPSAATSSTSTAPTLRALGPARPLPSFPFSREPLSVQDLAAFTRVMVEQADETLRAVQERNAESLRIDEETKLQREKIQQLEKQAQAIVDGARGQIDHARIILGHERTLRSNGRAKLDSLVLKAVEKDEELLEWDDSVFSDDELPPPAMDGETDRIREKKMYTKDLEEERARREWWQKRLEWKALHRANKGRAGRKDGSPLFTAKDVPNLVQAQRERALGVIMEARENRERRVQTERVERGEEAGIVDHTVPFAPEDFAGIEDDEDAANPEGDGWLVWDWFTGPLVNQPRDWEPYFEGRDVAASEYFKVY